MYLMRQFLYFYLISLKGISLLIGARMVPTEYCSIKRSILLFILVIMAKIKIRKGEMHLKAMAKNMSTNAESNFTTDIAM